MVGAFSYSAKNDKNRTLPLLKTGEIQYTSRYVLLKKEGTE
jgi:hypothetical protein